MKSFKFFQRNIIDKIRSIESQYVGQLQWMELPVAVIFYTERIREGNFYTEELRSTTAQITSMYIRSYNQFMEDNRENLIYTYQFVRTPDLSDMIFYNQNNFDDMPRDTGLIFQGVIRNNETI